MFRVEHRGDFYHIVDAERNEELAPVFDYEITAKEICEKVNQGYPFFQHIPTVRLGLPYPRPDIIIPRPFPQKVSLS